MCDSGKRQDLTPISVADDLNGRSKMTLGYSTPLEVYAQHLQRLSLQADSVH